jgi:hypothetical protein
MGETRAKFVQSLVLKFDYLRSYEFSSKIREIQQKIIVCKSQSARRKISALKQSANSWVRRTDFSTFG